MDIVVQGILLEQWRSFPKVSPIRDIGRHLLRLKILYGRQTGRFDRLCTDRIRCLADEDDVLIMNECCYKRYGYRVVFVSNFASTTFRRRRLYIHTVYNSIMIYNPIRHLSSAKHRIPIKYTPIESASSIFP